MGKRRAKGEGSLYQRSDGRWVAVLELAPTVGGRRKRRYLYGRTQAEALRKRKEAEKSAKKGHPPEDVTLGKIAERYMRIRAMHVRISTLRVDRGRWKTIAPVLSMRVVSEITREDIEDLVESLAERYAPRTVGMTLSLIRRLLDDAVARGHADENVAAKVKAPPVGRPRYRFLDHAEVSTLLKATEGTDFGCLILVLVALGLRVSESVGLRWRDWDGSTVHIRKQIVRDDDDELYLDDPKSDHSIRDLLAPETVNRALTAHRARQAKQRLLAGPEWRDNDLIFCDEFGRPRTRQAVRSRLSNLSKRLGMKSVSPHALRHTCGSLLLAEGRDLKEIQYLLGHSSIKITADVYAHITPKVKERVADTMEKILQAAK